MEKMSVKKLTVAAAGVAILVVVLLVSLGSLNQYTQQVLSPPSPTQREIARTLVSPQEALVLIERNKANQEFVILDFRTPEEFETGHIENAINIDFYVGDRTNNSKTLIGELNKLDKNRTYLVYCLVDFRSAKAAQIMMYLGFEKVYDVAGGITQWKAEGLPVVK